MAPLKHPNIKPGNIMLTRDGVKVLDFGLAKSTVVVLHWAAGLGK